MTKCADTYAHEVSKSERANDRLKARKDQSNAYPAGIVNECNAILSVYHSAHSQTPPKTSSSPPNHR